MKSIQSIRCTERSSTPVDSRAVGIVQDVVERLARCDRVIRGGDMHASH
jgi:hypothetical protein